MSTRRVPTMGGTGVLSLAFIVLVAMPAMLANGAGASPEAGRVAQVQSVDGAGRNGSYNASSVAGRKDGGGGGGGNRNGGGGGGGGSGTRPEQHGHDDGGRRAARRQRHRHRPSYSSSLYRVGEYARCTAPGRCRGVRLLCPMQCDGPCFYDCDANCKAHCRF